MPKAPRDKASATPKKSARKSAAITETVVPAEVSTAAEGHNGNGVHSDNGKVAAVPAVPSPAVAVEQHTNTTLEERIRARAFELYLERGGNGGSPEQDWLRAKEEISGRQSIA